MSPGTPASNPAVLSLPKIPEHEMLSPIASGAYGQVWMARNRLGGLRAVKIVHRASFDHDRPFEREFAGIKACEPISRSHEGLVDLLQVGRDDPAGYFYYVMELADNENGVREGPNAEGTPVLQDPSTYLPRTLASELKRRGRLPLEECIQIGLLLTDALAYLHRQGLVHRDVKPSNIIFVGGVPKLADVGLVAAVADARSFVGTEGFIPPEGTGTAQADLYSLGIVLYVLSTGNSHQDFPEPLDDLSKQGNHGQWLEFDAVVHKACQASPRERYQTAGQMHEDLALLQRGGSVRAKQAAQRGRSIATKIGLVAAVLVLLIAPLSLLKPGKHGYTPNPEAARLYEQGRWYYSQLTPEAHIKARQYLNQAAQADPKFVKPYGEWLMLYTFNMLPDSSTSERRLQLTKEIADKALAIDPGAAEGHVALSWYKFLQRDWRGAEDEIQRAIRFDPNLSLAHDIYSFYLSLLLRTDEARREGKRAEELESPGFERVTAIISAWSYMADRRFDLAIAELQRVLDLDRNFLWGHMYLGNCYEYQSNCVAAIEEYRTQALLLGQDKARVAASFDALRQAYDTGGRTGYLRKWIELIHVDRTLPADQQIFSDTDPADYYALLGDKEKALDELEKHFDEPNVWHQIKFIAPYDTLRNEPRYKALVRRAGLEP